MLGFTSRRLLAAWQYAIRSFQSVRPRAAMETQNPESAKVLTPPNVDDSLIIPDPSEAGIKSAPVTSASPGEPVPRTFKRIPLYPRPLHELAAQAEAWAVPIQEIVSLPPVVTEMPPLVANRDKLATIELRENASHMPWHQSAYLSFAAATYMMEGAIVHGAVGIVALGDYVVGETLWHTTPERHRYERSDTTTVLLTEEIKVLSGSHVSVLVGGAENYWHSVIDVMARLMLIPDDVLRNVESVMLPATGVAQRELIDLFGLPEGVAVRIVEPEETFIVERLVFPSSIHGLFDYHPVALRGFYQRILNRRNLGKATSPKLLYVDRRGSGLRRLLNEDALAAALEAIGFQAVRLEHFSIRDQIDFFAGADVIVGPHGAGLTNIGFARPGCVVIELMMDFYLNWCYRRIAAIQSLRYDCVIGSSLDPLETALGNIHLQTWTVSIDEVIATVKSLSGEH